MNTDNSTILLPAEPETDHLPGPELLPGAEPSGNDGHEKKKKRFSVFLFQKNTDRYRVVFWIWNWFFVLASGIVTGVLSLLLAFGNEHRDMFSGYFSHPMIAFLNILPAVLLTVFLYVVFGRAWLAYLLSSALILGMSAGNYFKLAFRNDPFIAMDVNDMAMGMKFGVGSYDLYINGRLLICIASVVIGTLFLALFVRGRMTRRKLTLVRWDKDGE